MSYIGKVSTADGIALIGSTLYGICLNEATEPAKQIMPDPRISTDFINNNYDQLIRGTTIHIKFTNGNTVTENVTFQIGSVISTQPVSGDCVCPAGAVLSFTLDESDTWVVNYNTQYEFKTAYSPTNKALTEADINTAASKGVVINLAASLQSNDLPTAAAVAAYVQDMTGGLESIAGAMHFRGIVSDPNVTITDGGTQRPHIEGYDYENGSEKASFSPAAGDVIIYNQAEYVWNGATNPYWELLGDEGSYALSSDVIHKSDFDHAGEIIYATGNDQYSKISPNSTTVNKVLLMNNSVPSWKKLELSGQVVTEVGASDGTWPAVAYEEKTVQTVTGNVPPVTVTVDKGILQFTNLSFGSETINNPTGELSGGSWQTVTPTKSDVSISYED